MAAPFLISLQALRQGRARDSIGGLQLYLPLEIPPRRGGGCELGGPAARHRVREGRHGTVRKRYYVYAMTLYHKYHSRACDGVQTASAPINGAHCPQN